METFAQIAAMDGRRRLIRFAGFGIAAYVLALVATMPASVVFPNRPWRTGVEGTIWHGAVGIAGGSTLAWDWAPLRSLTSLGFASDWRMTGGNTDLGGRALVKPGGRTVLDTVSGAADASLLMALQSDLPFRCEMTMQVEMPRIAIGGGARMADGVATSAPGACAATGGVAVAVPALRLSAEHVGQVTRILLTPATQRRQVLVDATLAEDGALAVSLTPAGAATLPFIGLPGGAALSFRM